VLLLFIIWSTYSPVPGLPGVCRSVTAGLREMYVYGALRGVLPDCVRLNFSRPGCTGIRHCICMCSCHVLGTTLAHLLVPAYRLHRL